MRKLVAAVPVLVLVVASCTGGTNLEPEAVESAGSCDDLVPLGAELVRRTLVAVEGAPLAVVTGEAPPGDELAGLQAIGQELDLRAAGLGCDPDELNASINEETSDLETSDPVGALYLDVVREGVVGSLPPAPATPSSG